MRNAALLTAFSLGVAGCSSKPVTPTRAGAPVTAGTATAPVLTLSHGDPRVGTYVSVPRGFTTSSYWIEGPTGLLLIDTQFLLSAASEFVDWAEKATGKKAVAAIVLHPNPDKFNGTEVLRRRGIRVLTSEQVLKLIPEVHKDRHYWFYERYKPDYPDQAPLPESFGARDTSLTAAGVTVKLHVLGAGASEAHVVVEFEGHVFVGDLVANLHHSWLEIGKTDQWLRRLAEIRALKPEYVHPGRGPDGGPELLDREEAYLRRVIALVRAEHPHGDPDDEENAAVIERLRTRLVAEYPGYGNEFFLEIGIPAEWTRQVRKVR